MSTISIHTVLADCDPFLPVTISVNALFQSTQSSQTVTNQSRYQWGLCFISIHTVLADCDVIYPQPNALSGISIHTVLADCDRQCPTGFKPRIYFNPHSPRRLWPSSFHPSKANKRFQSTQSSQTVTATWGHDWERVSFQSTQSSQTVTINRFPFYLGILISIHTVLADCDEYLPLK